MMPTMLQLMHVKSLKKHLFIHLMMKKVIEGQATVGLEIFNQTKTPIDYIFVAVGGGGLASGLVNGF